MNAKLELALKSVTVLGHAVAEKVRTPVPVTAQDVPISAAHVTPEWLTAVLCRDVPGAKVVSFDVPGGSSGSTERLALRVTYNDAGREAGLPEQMFTKSGAKVAQRLLTGGAGVLMGEVHFYRDLRPKTDAEAPLGYWANADATSWRSIALMEDIASTKDARFVESAEALDRGQMEDLVANLARLHGDLWGDPAVGVLPTPIQYFRRTTEFVSLKARCKVGAERAAAQIPAALRGQTDRVVEATEQAMQLATDGVRTLLHGDAHVGQTYQTGAGAMGLADWHHCLQGSWAFDFAYLVNSACEPEDRRAWDRELVELYLDRLSARGVSAPTFDDAWLAYRQQCLWPLTAWLFTIGRAWYQPEMQPVDRCRAIIRRTATAIADHDSFAALEAAR